MREATRVQLCEYFTRYGNNGVAGSCVARATLKLMDNGIPPICVCGTHARAIVDRFPALGGLERFAPIGDV